MQTRLTEKDAKLLGDAADMISQALVWGDTDEGHDYWDEVYEHLRNKAANRTSDGKPYIEPEPPIPEGYRKANVDEWRRTDVMVWSYRTDEWEMRLIQGSKFDPPGGRSIYIVPIDPPLTDEDARERPWVMVRNSDAEKFRGPYRLGMVNQAGWKYTVFTKNDKRDSFFQARRATREEIEAAE